jgi:hypothetical protein
MNAFVDYVNFIIAIYISLPILLLLLILFRYFIGKSITKETTDKLIDFGKWYMASIVIVLTVKIIDSSYTERELSIKEVAVYEKYATTIIEADNLEKRWKLAQYFATVTPSDRLRSRWADYQEIIKHEYDTLLELNTKRNKLLSSTSPLSNKQKAELLQLDQKVIALNNPLSNDEETHYWIIVFSADKSLKDAISESNKLKNAGITDVYIMKKGAFYINVSKEYSSSENASFELALIKKKVRKDVYIAASKKFCKNKTITKECLVCD